MSWLIISWNYEHGQDKRYTMRNITLVFFCIWLSFFIFNCGKSNESKNDVIANYWPTEGWLTSTPEQQGMDSRQLVNAFNFIQKNKLHIHSMLIIRNGYAVVEAYFYPYTHSTVHNIASVTKSITSVLVGIALDKGYIKDVKKPFMDYFRDRSVANLDVNKENVTIENLLTMSTGFCRDSHEGEVQLGRMSASEDWVQFILDLPMVTEPGQDFAYFSGGCQLISAIITQTTGMNELDFAREHLFQPLGIHDVIWPTDPQGNNTGWGDLFMHPLDMAKIGYLLLNEGRWEDKQVLSSEWVKQSTHQHAAIPNGQGYGYLWWVSGELSGLYEARGRGGQSIAIWPEKDLIVVFTGGGFESREVGSFIVNAIQSDQPLQENIEVYRRLKNKIEAAAKQPIPKPVSPLPSTARKISGKTFIFEPNAIGLRSFSLSFEDEAEALFKQDINGRVIEARIGLDGVYRISNSSRFGLPAALKGFWATENEFVLVFYEAANNFLYRTVVHFENDTASCRIVEKSGLVDLTLKAKIKQ